MNYRTIPARKTHNAAVLDNRYVHHTTIQTQHLFQCRRRLSGLRLARIAALRKIPVVLVMSVGVGPVIQYSAFRELSGICRDSGKNL